MKDIEKITSELMLRHPGLKITQLKVTHEADDDGIWFITLPGIPDEIQLEASTGECPFIIDSSFAKKVLTGKTVDDTVAKIEVLITQKLGSSGR